MIWRALKSSLQFVRKLKRPVTLEAMKRESALADMRLLQRGNRLSVFPVDEVHWDYVLEMSKS